MLKANGQHQGLGPQDILVLIFTSQRKKSVLHTLSCGALRCAAVRYVELRYLLLETGLKLLNGTVVRH